MGVNDELKFTSLQTSTDDEERAGYTRVLKLGLVRYVTSTAIAEKLQVVYKGVPREKEAAAPGARSDPWNFWIFRIEGSGSFEA